MTRVVVLGATGSIGRQTLEVAAHLGAEVVAVAARSASPALAEIADAWPNASVVAAAPDRFHNDRFAERYGDRYAAGEEALVDLARTSDAVIVNGVVGAAGLAASVAALEEGNRLGLANKESLVTAGPLVLDAASSGGGTLIPIDSEHSALFQCMVGEDIDDVDRLILTASGGPFRGKKAADLAAITPEQALAHPTWNMGRRITIDSATLVNKGLEVIEAHFLFGLGYDQVDVVVHPQSIVHSIVEFRDGSLKAHLGATDMRIPIQYALTYPERAIGLFERFDLTARPLEFESPDRETFPALRLAYEAGRAGGSMPTAFNAADEVAVEAFLDGAIEFLEISRLISDVLDGHESIDPASIEAVQTADAAARKAADDWVKSR